MGTEESELPDSDMTWEVSVEVEARQVYRLLQRALQKYRDEHRGPTVLAVQAVLSVAALVTLMPGKLVKFTHTYNGTVHV